MPFTKDSGQREHPDYCSYCYRGGKFCHEGDMASFQQKAYEGMVRRGMNKLQAKFFTWVIRFAPRWRTP